MARNNMETSCFLDENVLRRIANCFNIVSPQVDFKPETRKNAGELLPLHEHQPPEAGDGSGDWSYQGSINSQFKKHAFAFLMIYSLKSQKSPERNFHSFSIEIPNIVQGELKVFHFSQTYALKAI